MGGGLLRDGTDIEGSVGEAREKHRVVVVVGGGDVGTTVNIGN